MPDQCLNCGTVLRGSWCHVCGQRIGPARLSLRGLVAGFVRESLSFDGRIGRTAWPLFLRPGILVRAFLDGRRVRYASPVRLYLFALVVGFVGFRCAGSTEAELDLHIDPHGVWVGERPEPESLEGNSPTAVRFFGHALEML